MCMQGGFPCLSVYISTYQNVSLCACLLVYFVRSMRSPHNGSSRSYLDTNKHGILTRNHMSISRLRHTKAEHQFVPGWCQIWRELDLQGISILSVTIHSVKLVMLARRNIGWQIELTMCKRRMVFSLLKQARCIVMKIFEAVCLHSALKYSAGFYLEADFDGNTRK